MSPASSGRICFYCIATHLGGAERSLLELVTRIETQSGGKYRPWLLLPKEDGPLINALLETAIPYTVLPMPRLFFKTSRSAPMRAFIANLLCLPALALYLIRAARLLRAERPAAIHTTGIKCHALSVPLGALSGIPVIWHLRDILASGLTRRVLRKLRAIGQPRLIANSRATAQAFLPSEAQGERAITLVPNGLDPARYQIRRNRAYNDALELPHDVPMIGIIGVLARWKGQLEFLEMARGLVASGRRLGFAVIGGEIYDTVSDIGFAQELKDRARALGIADKVHFAGFAPDPVQALGGLDILVHASVRPEPFGRVIVEAMACQVPLIASQAGGVLEIVVDGETGLLFEPGRPERMQACVERYLDDPALRERIRAQAYQRFLDRFTIERYVAQAIRCYDEWLRD